MLYAAVHAVLRTDLKAILAYSTISALGVMVFSREIPERAVRAAGLGQMIAMRYGSVPIVRATGGLADTVQDGITGFSFYDFSSYALWNAIQRATYIYNVDKEGWRHIQANGMQTDFSWQRSAQGYEQLYEWALAQKRYRG